MPNNLYKENSPYLLQHANNPVQWYAWGNEALEKANREDKPIFLSIGYAACHWCHVMAHESFENTDTAELMNKNFVNVKNDAGGIDIVSFPGIVLMDRNSEPIPRSHALA